MNRPPGFSQQEQWMRAILESLPLGLWLTDRHGAILLDNPAAIQLWGKRFDADAHFAQCQGWWPDTGLPLAPSDWSLARVIATGQPIIGEVIEIVAFDGQRKTIRSSAVPLHDGEQQFETVLVINEEITSLRESERDAIEARTRLDRILEQLTEGVVILSREGKAFLFNQAALQLHGFSASDLPPAPDFGAVRSLLDYRRPDGGPLPEEEWPPARVLRGETLAAFDVAFRRVDTGLTRWLSYNGAHIRDAHGEVELAILTVRDITARTAAEEALRRSEAEYRALFELAGVAKTEADMVTGRYLRVNRKYCEFTGYQQSELLQMSLNHLLYPEDRPENDARIVQALSGERGDMTFERRYRRKDGTTAWGLVSLAFIDGPDGHLRSLATIQDITASKQAEEAQRWSEERLRIALANSPVTVYAQDTELRYTFMYNPAPGYESDAAIGHTDDELIAPEDAARLIALKRQVLATGESLRAEVQVGGDLGRSYFDLSVEPLRAADGTIVGVTGAAFDITQRKWREQRDRLLAEAGEMLGASLDVHAALRAITDLLVPMFADWCVVSTVEDGWVVRQAARHVDPAGQEFLQNLVPRYRLQDGEMHGVAAVIATGEPIFRPHGSLADDARPGDEDLAQRIARGVPGAVSQIVVPLTTRGRVLGAINACLGPGGRYFDQDDLTLLEELAQRAALAIDNARLYATERTARESAERATARALRLQTATAALTSALTSDEVARVAVEACMATVGAVGGAITVIRPSDRVLEMGYSVGYPDDVVAQRQLLPLDHPTPRAVVARTGEPLWLDSPAEAAARYPDSILPSVIAHGQYSWAIVPLIVGGHVLGSLLFSFDRTHALDEGDRASLLALAGLSAQAIERARLFEAEQSARSHLQQILGVLPEAVLGVDAGGNFAFANGAAVALLGFDPVGQPLPIAGSDAFQLFGARRPDGSPYPDRELPLERAVLLGESTHGEQLVLRNAATGADVPVLVSAAPLRDGSGEVAGGIAAFQDITAFKALERVRDDFYAAVSHDLKNPLTIIRAHAQLVQRQLGKLDPAIAAPLIERLGVVVSATDRMNQLLGDLLDHARLQTGESLELLPQPTDLVALLRRLASQWDRLSDKHEFAVEASMEALTVDVDPRRFERVLENLLSNAVKYSPDGGKVILAIALDQAAEPESVLVAVRDSGIGVPAADLPHIFEPYQRGGNVRGQIDGNGLGLANARRLIEQHGGTIAISSVEGHGTEVTIRLPWI